MKSGTVSSSISTLPVIITRFLPKRSLSNPPDSAPIAANVPATMVAPNAQAGGKPNVRLAKVVM